MFGQGHSSGLMKSEVSAVRMGWSTDLLEGEEVARDRTAVGNADM